MQSTIIRTVPRPGMSVRDTAQASGTASTRQMAVTAAPSCIEFQNACT